MPNKLASQVIPVINVGENIEQHICESGSRSTTGESIIYTTPSDRDFYLTFVTISFSCNAACDSTFYYFRVTTPDSAEDYIFGIQKTTLTASQDTQSFALPIPLKLKRGSTIKCGQTFTAGASELFGSAGGYTTQTLKNS